MFKALTCTFRVELRGLEPLTPTARLAIRSRTRRGADLTAGRPLASAATRTAAPWQLDERDPVKAPLPAPPDQNLVSVVAQVPPCLGYERGTNPLWMTRVNP